MGQSKGSSFTPARNLLKSNNLKSACSRCPAPAFRKIEGGIAYAIPTGNATAQAVQTGPGTCRIDSGMNGHLEVGELFYFHERYILSCWDSEALYTAPVALLQQVQPKSSQVSSTGRYSGMTCVISGWAMHLWCDVLEQTLTPLIPFIGPILPEPRAKSVQSKPSHLA